jgi:septal ring factor EnvC (AmiA/AmiB activator)
VNPAPGRGRRVRRWLLLLTVCAAVPLAAQSPAELEKSRQRLEQIRRERQKLQTQQQQLQGRVTDVNARLRNIERQRDNASDLVLEIERQIGGLGSRLDQSAAELALAQDNLLERRAVLQRRLADIYKRGPLHTFQVLLAAESFGDLLTRYKYLYLTSRQDRDLMVEVERLNDRVRAQRQELLGIQGELDNRRAEREAELERYGQLASEQQSTLRSLQRSRTQTANRLTQLQRDEARVNEVLANLERARRSSTGAASNAPGALTTADLGRLDWPVEGTIIHQFGRQQLDAGGVIRWNGIAIGAAVGTPVKAVEDATVSLVQRLGTYGLTVILEHGNGYYSLYGQLNATSVSVGSKVSKGQTIGTVGGSGSDEGPHLYFEIRGENQIALDPMTWLRRSQ